MSVTSLEYPIFYPDLLQPNYLCRSYSNGLPSATAITKKISNGFYSYFFQMLGLGFTFFTSAATGIAVAIAFIRGLTGRPNRQFLCRSDSGNYANFIAD